MSERLHHHMEANENYAPHEEVTKPESHRRTHENHKSETSSAEKSSEEIQRLVNSAENLAIKAEVTLPDFEDRTHQPTQSFVNKEIKEMAYQRLLLRARKQMNSSQKTLSKIIHQPMVEDISETAAKTIARPSGFLGGGILAFSGTTLYYLLTKYYGYSYNYFVFLALLLLGFAAGWIIETILKYSRSNAK